MNTDNIVHNSFFFFLIASLRGGAMAHGDLECDRKGLLLG